MELWTPTSKVYMFSREKWWPNIHPLALLISGNGRLRAMFHGSIHLFHEQSKMFGVEVDQINTNLKIQEPWLWGNPPHRLTSYLENSRPLRDWIWFILVAGHKILIPQKKLTWQGENHRLKQRKNIDSNGWNVPLLILVFGGVDSMTQLWGSFQLQIPPIKMCFVD